MTIGLNLIKELEMLDEPLSVSSMSGLTELDAQDRLRSEGPNELPRPDRRTPLRIMIEVVREPMLILLLAGGLIYLVFGDLKEALILLVFATMSVVVTVVQETRTERVLEALRDLTSPRALVIRDGLRKRIAGREVVRGDLVVLAEGDRVPADAVLVQSQDLQTDESLLTGESVPVRKAARAIGQEVVSASDGQRPGGDDLPYVCSGSLIVRGTAVGEVTATGIQSEIGRIGQSLSTLETEPPRLQAQTRRLVRVFVMVGAPVSILAVFLYGSLRGVWLDAVLAGIALGMSMLPEELPIVLTVFMAMGAWRISQARVLTRRASAIETLGSATVLCTDKTGTLTQNRMTIVELRLKIAEIFRLSEAASKKIPESFHDLIKFGWLASAPEPFDPMDKAFHALHFLRATEAEHRDAPEWKLVHAYGLRPDLLAMSHVWQHGPDDKQALVIAAKGAPEAIADLCHLSADERAAVTKSVELMAGEGLRVLGVARASYEGPRGLSPNMISRSNSWVSSALPTRSGRACRRRSSIVDRPESRSS
jgi:P-type Ca2+ transporter type 2C